MEIDIPGEQVGTLACGIVLISATSSEPPRKR